MRRMQIYSAFLLLLLVPLLVKTYVVLVHHPSATGDRSTSNEVHGESASREHLRRAFLARQGTTAGRQAPTQAPNPTMQLSVSSTTEVDEEITLDRLIDPRKTTEPPRSTAEKGFKDFGVPDDLKLSHNTLIITFANYDWMHFLRNWVSHANQIGLEKSFVVAPMDEQTRKACAAENIPVLQKDMKQFMHEHGSEIFRNAPKDVSTSFLGQLQIDYPDMHAGIIGNVMYHRVIETKFHVWALALMLVSHLQINVLVSDSDVVWLRDPLPYLARFHGVADVSISTDCVSAEVERLAYDVRKSRSTFNISSKYNYAPRCGHLPMRISGTAFNAGVAYVRATPASTYFLRDVVHGMLGGPGRKDPYWDDQYVVNEYIVQRGRIFPVEFLEFEDKKENIVLAHKFNMDEKNKPPPFRLHTLPITLFNNGHTFFVDQMPKRLGIDPYAVHATWQMSGNDGKLSRFRRAHVWNLDNDNYYDTMSGRYLTYEARYPAKLVDDSDLVNTHMRVVQYHIHGLRNAIAIAQILRRTLVLPEFHCYCDRDEHPDIVKNDPPTFRKCTTPGSDLVLPYECPLDHLFDVSVWEHNLHGQYRESTFLKHPKVVARGMAETNIYVGSTVDGVPSIPINATDAEISRSLASFSDVPLLRFGLDVGGDTSDESAMNWAFGSFVNEDQNQRFNKLVSILLEGSWCCTSFDKSVGTWHFDPPEALGRH